MRDIILITLFILVCCSSPRKADIYKYAEARSSFSHEFSDHFPSNLANLEITGLYYITPENSDITNNPHLFLTCITDSIHIIELKQRIINSNLAKYSPDDTTLLIIGDTNNYQNIQSGVPVPCFKEIGFDNCRLTNDYLLYIYDSQPGKYLRSEQLTNNPNLPQEWRNGYTKGLAINSDKSEVIFWMSIW
jgi:hypothetical protein